MVTSGIRGFVIDDLEGLDPNCRHEIIRGELISMAPSGYEHSNLAATFAYALMAYALETKLGGVTTADGGYILARDPDTLLVPDCAFVRAERLPSRDLRKQFPELAPDLVVEVVSPSDTAAAVANKVNLYLDHGVTLVWVIFPDQRSATVYKVDRSARVLRASEGDALDGGDVLPGFQLPLTEVFGEA